MTDEHVFLLQRIQPMMVGLIDGSLSTLAPIFAVALASHDTRYAFIAGLATSLGAAISMGFSEALSDTGELTGRGSPVARGIITGGGTFLGGILHTLPFLTPHYEAALFFVISGTSRDSANAKAATASMSPSPAAAIPASRATARTGNHSPTTRRARPNSARARAGAPS